MIVDVAVPVPVAKSFHYRVPKSVDSDITVGSLLEVPFGSRRMHGFVLGFPEQAGVDSHRMKEIGRVVVSKPLFDESTLSFFRRVSEYYCHPLGEVISAAIPKSCWSDVRPLKKGGREKQTIDLTSLVQDPPPLTEDQRVAVNAVLEDRQKLPVLLHGVTGSGKTEVYIRVIEAVLADQQGAIVLVPEISLTPQLLARFSARFPKLTAVLHSSLTARQRRIEWQRVWSGEARVVIGARSAVFAPVKALGLIVVDEEHETSYKQEDQLRYHGRDMAVLRAQFEKARVVLGSATPSLESYSNQLAGKYRYVRLPKRIGERPMPHPILVDLKDTAQRFSEKIPYLSQELVARLRNCLAQKEQALLYLNRLGYAHFIYCKDCGHAPKCRSCDVSLTYYQKPVRLKCHYCGLILPAPVSCESCQGINFDTMGVGTEQLEKILVELFPSARIARMDRGVIRKKWDLESLIKRVADREIDIVIGTQMIAKGHDFPGVTLVGILVADASLNLPDFRANEKTFQTIVQVSGRAGRGREAGKVVIQTLNPLHPVLQWASRNALEEFYENELAQRKVTAFPPFTRMVLLRFQHRNASLVQQFSLCVAENLKRYQSKMATEIFGPSEAPLARIKNLYRWQCLVKGQTVSAVRQACSLAFEIAAAKKTNVQMAVDVDPIHLL